MSLADFVLARVAEDETFVTDACDCWDGPSHKGEVRGPHVAQCPERVRDECRAKRRLIDWCAPVSGYERVPTGRRGVYDRREVRYPNEDGEDVLRYLALPYADHPDYREEWRP